MEIRIKLEAGADESGTPTMMIYATSPDSGVTLRRPYTGNEILRELFKDCVGPVKVKGRVEIEMNFSDRQTVVSPFRHPSENLGPNPDPFNGLIRKNDIVKWTQTFDDQGNKIEREDGFVLVPGKSYRVLDVVADGAAYEISDDSSPARITVMAKEITFERREPKPYKKPYQFETVVDCKGEGCGSPMALSLNLEGTMYFGKCPKCGFEMYLERPKEASK